MGGVFCKEDSAKGETDEFPDRVPKESPSVKNFQDLGGDCFNRKQYPEATFWFFLHQQSVLNGAPYTNYDTALANSGPSWSQFTIFLTEHWKNKTIDTQSNWDHVKILWQNMAFERRGGDCFNSGDYAEAGFWFFQHKVHRLGGMDYSNVPSSVHNAGPDWKGFDTFLEDLHSEGKLREETTWTQVQDMWKNRKKE